MAFRIVFFFSNRFCLLALFCVFWVQGNAQTFSAQLLPNQTFNRPSTGPVVCGDSSFGTFVTVTTGSNIYSYATQSFTVSTAGFVVIEVTSSSPTISDPMLMVYSRFNPFEPTRDFKVGDDDSGGSLRPLIACENFFSPGTYTLVVTTFSSGPLSGTVNFNISAVEPVFVLPTVTTSTATSITSNSTIIGGSVTEDGGADVTERGVVWGTESNPTNGTSLGDGLGSFEGVIFDLTPGTTYYYRAYAINSVGTAYGEQQSFTTLSAPLDPTSISATENDICVGGSVELTAIGAEGEVYWYTGGCDNEFFTTGNPITVSPIATTTYFARNFNNGLFSNGCASVQLFVVGQSLPPTLARVPDIATVCAGQFLTITASPGVGGGEVAIDEYSFSTDNGASWSPWLAHMPAFEAVVGSNTVRGRRVTSSPGCNESSYHEVTWEVVEQPSAPEIKRVPDIDNICHGTVLTIEATPGSGGTGVVVDEYRFSTNNGISWSEWLASVPQFSGFEGTCVIQSRRTADGIGCNLAENQVSWLVYPSFIPPVIGADQLICYGDEPSTLTATEAYGGSEFGFVYQWQFSEDQENWYDVPGGDKLTLDVEPLEQSMFYRVKTTEPGLPNCADNIFSNILSIQVREPFSEASIFANGGVTTICHLSVPPLLEATIETNTIGLISYVWEASTTNSTDDFFPVPGESGHTFQPGPLEQTTWFRRITSSIFNEKACLSDPTTPMQITVQEMVEPGRIEGDQVICTGGTPLIVGNQEEGAGTGSLTYFWESSTTSATEGFSSIPDHQDSSFQPGPLTQETWFRRRTISTLNNVSCQSEPTLATHVGFFEQFFLNDIEIEHVYCRRPEEGGAINFIVEGGAPPVSFLWSNEHTTPFLQGVEQGSYYVTVIDYNGCTLEQNFVVEFLDEDCIIRVPQGFSPDGDGINDNWEIRNLLEMHPENALKIFNRQGVLVFESSPYFDNWDGTPNQGNVLVGQDGKVPPGVYFFMIWFDGASKPISGSVFVSY